MADLTINVRARVGGDQDECRLVVRPVALRADGSSLGVLDGYGAVFNQWTQIGDGDWGFQERIAPGAFAKSIKEDDIRSFFNHDSNQVLGRTAAGTLDLEEDETGLHVVIRPPNTSAARDVVTLIERGDVSGMSFMFRVRKGEDQWDEGADGEPLKRTILGVQLYEVGPVTFPQYEQTSISARDHVKAVLDARRQAQELRARTAGADLARVDRLRLARVGR